MSSYKNNNLEMIREVWKDNLIEEVKRIDEIVDKCKYIAFDTEFGGHHIKHRNFKILDYKTMKANVECVKLIQVGLTFSDKHGKNPHVWQFNFNTFHPEIDSCYDQDSIDLLIRCGIDFDKNKTKGMSEEAFGEVFMTCGAVLNDDVRWVTFHGAYDVAYLVRILKGTKKIPDTEGEFLEYANMYLRNLYDVKYMVRGCLYGGLKKIAETMKVERVGSQHQAGSDSLLTCQVFMELKDSDRWWFKCDNNSNGGDDDEKRVKKYCGVLFGMGVDSKMY